ncbi:MAG: hypothetical protein AAB776_01925, partial [Patescibacteria group bacterium]
IDFTNFDVASTGAITVAAGLGLDTNAAGNLALGNTTATSVAICNSAACDTIALGTNADADAITIGDGSLDTVAIGGVNWTIVGSGLFTTASDIALNGGDLTSTSATFNFLDAASNSTTLDIGGVTTDLGNTINIATNSTTADVISIGNSNASSTIALTGGDDWSITTAGAATFGAITANGASAFNDDIDLTFVSEGAQSENLSVTVTHATDVSTTPITVIMTDTAAADTGANYFLALNNANDGGATGTPDGFIIIESADTNESVASGVLFSIDPSASLTTALDASDAEIGTALSIGANILAGTTGTIDFDNFDVSSAGVITVAASAGLDTNGAGTLLIGATNATGVGVCNSAACDTLLLGTNGDADTITIGDGSVDTVSIGGASWAIVAGGAITTAGDLALNGGDLTSTSATFNLLATASTTVNAFSAATALNITDAAITGTIDIGGVTADGATTVNIATNATSADAISIGNSHASSTVAIIGGDDWTISALGNATFNNLTTNGTASFNDDVNFNFVTDGTASENIDIDVTHASDVLLNVLSVSFTDTATASTAVNSLGLLTNADDGGVLTGTPDAFLILNNADIDESVAVGISLTSAAGTLLTGVDASDADIVNAFDAGQNFIFHEGIRVGEISTGTLTWEDASGNDFMTLTDDGSAGTLTARGGLDVTVGDLRVVTELSGRAAIIFNDGAVDTNDGLEIQACADLNPTSTCDFIKYFDGDGTTLGAVEGNGAGGVTNSSAGSDYAELFPGSYNSFSTGDVLALDASGEITMASDSSTTIGAFSIAPNTLGNWKENWKESGIYVPVALLGQVPVNVNTSNGSIQPGDRLALSSTPGQATKHVAAGQSIGIALEGLAVGSGQIMVFIQPSWHVGDIIADDGGLNSVTATLALESLSTATASAPASDSNTLAFRGSAWNGSAADTLTMSLSNKVTNVNNYRLSVANSAGAEVAYINNVGDLVLSGKLYPSNQGVAQTSAYIYYDNNGVGYMRTNAAGWGTGSYDFAEMFPSPEILSPGDVVVFGDGVEQVKRSTGETYDDRIAGVVSTRPGFLAGTYKPGDSPIALSGRVPTRVNTENGAIAIGDPLTTSSTPGVAMKATESGPIVGYAMQPLPAGSGLVTVFIRASYYDGDGFSTPVLVEAPVSQVGSAGNLSSLSLNGGSITSVASISGLGNTWRLTESGDLITKGRVVQVVKSYQNEDVETYAAASREMTIQLSGTSVFDGNAAIVKFEDVDPKFNDIIGTASPYRVLATPSGVTGQIYVTNRTASGFTINAESSANGVLIDWLVIAYHKDYEPEVVDVVTDPVEEPIDESPVIPEETIPEPEVAGDSTEVTEPEPVVEEPVIEEAPVDEPVIEVPEETAPVIEEPPVTEPIPEATPEVTPAVSE